MSHETRDSISPRSFNRPSISLSSFPVVITSKPTLLSSSKQNDHEEPTSKKFVLRDNLYDYQDPWNAIGVILGLENGEHKSMADGDPQEALGRLPAEILDHPDAPDDEAASVHSQHSSNTLSSNYSHGSSTANHTHHTTSDHSTDDARQSLLPSLPLTPARPTVHNAHVEELPINTSDSPHELKEPKCETIPELDSTTIDPEPFGRSTHHSNPTTPLSSPNIIGIKPFFSVDDFDNQSNMRAEQIRTPSPMAPRPPSSRGPKFEKFPSRLNVEHRAAHHSRKEIGMPFTPTSRDFKFQPPRSALKLKRLTSCSPSSPSSPDHQVSREAGWSAEVVQHKPDISRYFDNAGAEYPDAREGTDVEITHTLVGKQFVEDAFMEEKTEADVPSPRKPEKFFGDLCLFSDDIDEPESDD
ncbi:hypothetical protein FB451DRAFT_1408090 [Mycena latifolia]|nr:hypothetical protein FB451DRAFT_1408090 [Mycena latifolia]